MDKFNVSTDSEMLKTSHLVNEMQLSSEEMDLFPVLIGDQVAHFHDVDGGVSNGRSSSYDVVNFIHRVQGPDQPSNAARPSSNISSVEAHMDDMFYHLSVDETRVLDEYPDDDFVFQCIVTDYMIGRETFSDALTADIDGREQEFGPNYERY